LVQRAGDVSALAVEYPPTRKLGASSGERAADLIAAFEDPEIKAVISTLGGDDQVTYVKNLPKEPFANNPKPYFGYSDNTHFMNHLWQCGVPSYYGGALFTQFAMQGEMDRLTVEYLKHGLFDDSKYELRASDTYSNIGLSWNDPETLNQRRTYEPNDGWFWNGEKSAEGNTWGGCVESIDELLRHGVAIPTLEQFEHVILIAETFEHITKTSR
jgi:muramoyltetrapeptide carboxypeptidase LdcA involved in peptidoglycan recycling